MAVDVERHQAERIEALTARVREDISPMELAHILTEVTSDSAFVAFPLLLSLPVFTKLEGPDLTSLDVLRLFAYGTWQDYKSNSESFPPLLPTQIWKLKQLTVLALARSNKKLTYARLKSLLDFSDVESLSDFLQSCNNTGIVRGNLNKQQECFEVLYTVDSLQKSHGRVKAESFDGFLERAKNDSSGTEANLLCNGVVRQVPLPQDGTNCCTAELQPKANSLFVSLIGHVTSAHAIGKSFNGQIYTGMFDVIGEQLLLNPAAAAQKNLTPQNFDKDRKVVAFILRENTGLSISHTGQGGIMKQILYPLYMENLLDHLEGKISNLQQVHLSNPMSMSRDKNYITFLLCHPTFLKHAVRSVLFWYVRVYHKSSSKDDQTKFASALDNIKIKHDWYNAIQNHWLFKKVFDDATYNDTKTDCFRFLRDWEIHVPKHLSEAKKVEYTSAVINYLAACHFDDFLPDALYQLLCTYSEKDSKFDLKDWIQRLQQLPEEDTAVLTVEWDQLVLHGFPTNNALNHQTDQIVLQLESLRHNVTDGTSNHFPLKKWRMLNILRGKSEAMYYKVLIDNIEEYAPVVYMPTIRTVCRNSSAIRRSLWGMYLSAEDQGHMMSILHRSPVNEVDLIVVTDGNSVGDDLGTKGMGIAVGKSDLYVATAGINPHRVLPFMIDVGTNNEELLNDPLYHGMQRHRLDEQGFRVVIDEFMSAVFTRWPKVIVQFEGFETKCGFKLLEQYKTMYRTFNDEIQGTIGVLIAGLLRAVQAQGKQLSDFQQQRILVTGVDSVGVAILDTLARVLGSSGLSFGSIESARNLFWIVDEQGLLTDDRANVDEDKSPFARKKSQLMQDLCEGAVISDVVKIAKPDIFLIFSADTGLSSQEVLESIKDFSSSLRPAIFALSNPQFSAEKVFGILGENVVFASTVQFSNVDHGNGKIGYSNCVNSIYLYPGIALGTLLSGAYLISDEMLYAAAKCLTSLVKDEEVVKGMLYPPLSSIRDITKKVAGAVLTEAVQKGLAQGDCSIDASQLAKLSEEETLRHVEAHMWAPT